MSLSDKEKREIAEIVVLVLDSRLNQFRKEIVAGFAECIDWHNENFAKIMEEQNKKTVEPLLKKRQEQIEVRTQEVAHEKEVSTRLGFTAKKGKG